ncbi:MAG: hypothetical protein HUK24_06865 [Sphaerochaetaceae bacterium]|nr:hypothetical protein [Sphaerochaetaceae bacterium]
MINATSRTMAIIGIAGVGLSMSGIYPTTMSTQPEKYMKSSACSGICIGTATVATIIMPYIVGIVTKNSADSYKAGLKSLLVPIVCMIILMFVKIFNERNNRR